MRRKCEKILQKVFHTYAIRIRSQMSMTQADMAQMLEMSERSFADLDRGKSGCSGLTLALFLTYCCDDPKEFLEEFKIAYETETRVLL